MSERNSTRSCIDVKQYIKERGTTSTAGTAGSGGGGGGEDEGEGERGREVKTE